VCGLDKEITEGGEYRAKDGVFRGAGRSGNRHVRGGGIRELRSWRWKWGVGYVVRECP